MGSTSSARTKLVMSIVRELLDARVSSASRSASSIWTNWPFDTSQPRTISSASTSTSWTGHHRFCLIGVPHSRCSGRNDTSDCRAADFVVGARPTGMFTRPKLIEPFQDVRIGEGKSYREEAFSRCPAAFLHPRAGTFDGL